MKMPSSHVALVLGVILTVLNMIMLVANWSIAARSAVARMEFSDLANDTDFIVAVEFIVEHCRAGGDGRIAYLHVPPIYCNLAGTVERSGPPPTERDTGRAPGTRAARERAHGSADVSQLGGRS